MSQDTTIPPEELEHSWSTDHPLAFVISMAALSITIAIGLGCFSISMAIRSLGHG